MPSLIILVVILILSLNKGMSHIKLALILTLIFFLLCLLVLVVTIAVAFALLDHNTGGYNSSIASVIILGLTDVLLITGSLMSYKVLKRKRQN